MVTQVFQNISLNLAHIVHDNLCVVCDFSIIKGKCLRLRIVGENTFSNFCALSQSLTEGTVAVLDINRLDFISGRTNGFVSSRRSIAANGEIIVPLNRGLLVLKLAADLHFEQTTRNQTIGTADGDSLILLQRVQLATLLTGDVGLFLSLSDSCILQLVQSELECTSHDVKCIDGLKAGDGDIIDIHLDIPPICELANSNHLGLGLSR